MGRGRPIVIRTRMEVDPAGTGGRRRDLPWEISAFVCLGQTTNAVTRWEGRREVSRGHSSLPWGQVKDRIFKCKEQTERFDGREAAARHRVPAQSL